MADDDVLPVEQEAMERLRKRVLDLAAAQNLTQKDMERAARVAHSTYDGMWKRGTVTIVRLQRIAKRLEMDLLTLLGADASIVQHSEARAPYLEERVERIERDVRQLTNQLKKG